jgi:hypothetical protein
MSRELRCRLSAQKGALAVLLICCVVSPACSENSQTPAPLPPGGAAPEIVEEEKPPNKAKDGFAEIEEFKRKQREGLAKGAEWLLIGIWVPIVVGVLVFFILYMTPTEIPSARPFDKTRDRKKAPEPPPSGSSSQREEGRWL